jgi:D-alanyl-D-alanine carboxypeptidase
MAFPYRLVGGATRPDALQFNPAFNQALLDLYASAPADVQRELALTSGYRSPAVQQVLWDKSDKTGRNVAAPGKSKHQHGTAADLFGFGLGGDSSVSQATKDWVKANAGVHNLYFPMGHEPWHIQLRADGSAVSPASDTSLGETMAQAATGPTETEIAQRNLYSGIASGLTASSGGARSQGGVDVAGDPTGAPQAVGLPLQSAIPAAPAAAPLGAMPTLADLFKVKDIGLAALPTAPTRRA